MKKTAIKFSAKTKQKKLKRAIKARKIRKNNKLAKKINSKIKSKNISLLKRNILPLTVLIIGSFIFYYSNNTNFAKNEIEKPQDIANSTVLSIPEITNTASANDTIEPQNNSEALRDHISNIIKNTPMEAMKEEIIKRDRTVASFLLGIGMKESKYGIYSPKKDGVDCYNYWGYRGQENTTASGYSCFNSPEQAVQVVGDRIEDLVRYGNDTPEKMIVWKCGYSCAEHSNESVKKWISDVGINFYKLNPEYKFPVTKR